jgi:hypothetical protein
LVNNLSTNVEFQQSMYHQRNNNLIKGPMRSIGEVNILQPSI